MTLNPQDRETIRLCILRYCLRPTSVGLICANLRGEGFRGISRDQVQAEIDYLADPDKKLLRAEDKVVSPENVIYRTSAAGRDYLAQIGQEVD